jgi:predicted nucleic acid-binding Zn ribbon protein
MEKKRKSSLTSASDVLQGLLANTSTPLAGQFKRWRLWRNWQEVVGESIAKRTDPVGFRDGILYVWVENSVWMQQMIFLAKPIRQKINDYTGDKWVRQVRFTVDRRSIPRLEEAEESLKKFLK